MATIAEMNLARLARTSLLKEFVRNHNGEWNHRGLNSVLFWKKPVTHPSTWIRSGFFSKKKKLFTFNTLIDIDL